MRLPKLLVAAASLLLLSVGAQAAESDIVLPPIQGLDMNILLFVGFSAFVALAYGWYLSVKVKKLSPGSVAMQEVQNAIEDGAMAYLKRQFMTMIWFVIAITIGLYFLYAPIYQNTALSLGVAGWVALLLPVRYGLALLVAAFGALWLYEHRVLGTRLLPAEYLRLRRSLTLVVCSLLSLGLVALG